MSEPSRKPASLADLLAIPEDERFHEIIDGALVEKVAPSGEHGGVQANVATSLVGPFGRRSGGGPPERPGGWWIATEVEIDLGGGAIHRPDVVGWRRERVETRPMGTVIANLPDWVCEIVSPSKPARDLVQKKRTYHARRVPHYWILDPRDETLTVHRWSDDGYTQVLIAQPGERVRAEPFGAIELDVGVLFGADET